MRCNIKSDETVTLCVISTCSMTPVTLICVVVVLDNVQARRMEEPDFKTLSLSAERSIDPPPQGYDVWRAVCAMLPQSSLQAVGAVSPALRLEACGASITSKKDLHARLWWWKRLPVVRVHLYNPAEADIVAAFTHLRIEILRIDVTPLQNLPRLDASVAAMQQKYLRKVDLNGSPTVGDVHIEAFPLFCHVTAVRLIGCGSMGDAAMRSLSQMASLEILVMGECEDVTDAGMKALSQSATLRAVTMRRNTSVTPAGLGALCDLPNLTQLNLGMMSCITDDLALRLAARNLLPVAPIRRLRLHPERRGVHPHELLTDRGVRVLCSISTLVHLNLSSLCTGVCNESFDEMSSVLELQSLLLREQPNVGRGALQSFARLKKLTMLDVSFCSAVSPDFDVLAALVHLRTLYAEGLPKLSDKCAIAALTPMADLVHLKLNGCRALTDAALVALRPLRHLLTLGLRSCVGISPKGIEKFYAARVAVRVRGREFALLIDR
jgi:hypothetical protein